MTGPRVDRTRFGDMICALSPGRWGWVLRLWVVAALLLGGGRG
ncbi:MAG: hypothetical protein RIS76_4529, partial [Verrucomicrobiota bacterium]